MDFAVTKKNIQSDHINIYVLEANTCGVTNTKLKLRSISQVPLIICCDAKESGFASHP